MWNRGLTGDELILDLTEYINGLPHNVADNEFVWAAFEIGSHDVISVAERNGG